MRGSRNSGNPFELAISGIPVNRETGNLSNTSRYGISNTSDSRNPYVCLYLRNVEVLGAKNRATTPKYAPKFVGLSARPRPATLQQDMSRAKLESIKAGLAGLGCRLRRSATRANNCASSGRQNSWHPHPGGTRSGCSKNIVGR